MPRRLVALAAGMLVITASFATPVAAAGPEGWTAQPVTPLGVIDAPKSKSGAIAKSNPGLLARTDSAPVNVLVKLDLDAVATYDGRVDGFAATSPTITGKDVSDNDRAVVAYEGYLDDATDAAAAAIEAAIPTATVGRALTTAYGGVSVRLPADRARDLLKVDGVVAVQSDALVKPDRATSVDFIGAPRAWRQLGSSRTAGEGVVVGILDGGIWPEHPMLRDPGISHPGGTYECQFGDGIDPALGPAFTCNDKLVGAYAFVDTYVANLDVLPGEFCNAALECTARDADGHGTHTATTAAGSYVESAPIMGIERGPVSGIAPGASIVAFKVCLDEGCFQSDSIAAVEEAIELGIDVINFSIGGGEQAFADPVELAFLDAYAAGISVNASAGNGGPGAATAGHAGPWVTTVGASSYDHMYLSTLRLRADDGETFRATGATIVPGIDSATPVVMAEDVGSDAICTGPFPPGSVDGMVVVCQRGLEEGRVAQSHNVSQGGAAGMILYNPDIQSLFSDNFFVPTIMLEGPQPSGDLVAFLESHTGITARWETGEPTRVTPDTMAAFSSRGPLGDFLKPDVTAPGLQILAGTSPQPHPAAIPSGPPGELFQAIAGTSMSSPHATGVAALVRAAHPDWTPGQVKSALMTSSVQQVFKETGAPADPFDRGAGSIRADRAISPTVTLDVPAADYFATASDVLGRADLNLPSINVNPMPGSITTTRVVTNVSGRSQVFRVRTDAPDGVQISVSPSRFSLGIGQSRSLQIEIKSIEAPNGWYFGQITLDARRPRAVDAVLPVAFNKTQGSVTLSHSCDLTEITRFATTDCVVTATNLAPVEADVSLSVRAPSRLHIADISAPARPDGPSGWSWTGSLDPAVAPRIVSIEDAEGGSPAGGYLPLGLFGVDPIEGMGDETIANFAVPAFQYGSETYGQVGIDSNGYVVVGGGTADDNQCCNLQAFPDPTRPNNVLAPFWTDLDPSSGGGVSIAVLTDGTTDWLVIEWDAVPVFSNTPPAPEMNSFQVWIQVGDTEGVWFTYGDLGGSPWDLAAGAENRDGSSGVAFDVIAATEASELDDFVVTASPPTPGGEIAITYSAWSQKRGSYLSTASLQTQVVRGTTVQAVRINVR